MMWFLLIWSLSCLGFTALACSMSKHQKQFFWVELTPFQTRSASWAGWGLLLFSLIPCLLKDHWSTAISYWVVVLTFSALSVGLVTSYLAIRLKWFAIVMIIISLISAVFSFM
jgi:hypothetical protein